MKTLAVIGVPGAALIKGQPHIHHSFGLVIEELARDWERVLLAVPALPEDDPQLDFALPENVVFHGLPAMTSALQGLRQEGRMARIYLPILDQADAVFIRGVMIPAVDTLHRESGKRGLPTLHWLVGNPMALLRSHRRQGWLKDRLGQLFVWSWERRLRGAASKAGSVLLCNGKEIAARYRGLPTRITVSTSLRSEDIPVLRRDTCQGEVVRLLCVAFVRPEKGLEYLLQALARLKTDRPVHLTLVGSRDRYPGYQARLDQLVSELHLSPQVTWTGHADQAALATHFGQADLFVLPTLSEGTPRVLLEAQAHSLPLVATRVGGIPDTIADGKNGLLVPAKDPEALARALDRLITEGSLRRELIAAGHAFASENTVDRFARQIQDILVPSGISPATDKER